jgi:hypothetical protein
MNSIIETLLIFIYLCTVLICFTILAITFNNYWLVLLALLFLRININVNDRKKAGGEDDKNQ